MILKNVLPVETVSKLTDVYNKIDKSSTENLVRYITDVSKNEVVKEIAVKILQIVQPLVCSLEYPCIHETYGTCTFVNAPGNGTINQMWHRDTCFKSFIIIIPLVDVNLKNGCTQVIPKSSKLSVKKWKTKKKINLCLNISDIAVFDGRWLHRGTANKSDQDRPILILTITSANNTFNQCSGYTTY